MLRRAILRVFTTALVPDQLTRQVTRRFATSTRPRLPQDRHYAFWFHFYTAIKYDRALSTDRAREHAVEGCRFERTTREEAVRALELAHEGQLSLNDMPTKWREYWDALEASFDVQDPELRNRYAASTEQLNRLFETDKR